MKSDYFNFKTFMEETKLSELFDKIPHSIEDSFGNVISQKNAQETTSVNEITFNNQKFGNLKVKPEHSVVAHEILSLQLKNYIDQIEKEVDSVINESLLNHINNLNSMFSNDKPEEIHKQLIRIIQSYVYAEYIYIHHVNDDNSLNFISGMDTHKKVTTSNWNISNDSIDGIVLNSKQAYITNNASKDSNYSPSGQVKFKNILCVPMTHRNKIIGLINIRNKYGEDFTASDMKLVSLLAKIFGPLIQGMAFENIITKYESLSGELTKYVGGDLIRNLEKNSQNSLGGDEKKVVVLFADIRSFTTITEGIKPNVLVSLLNFYFEEMNKVIKKHNGEIDKIVGDLIMVVWNDEKPEAELSAVRCAFEMQKVFRNQVASVWSERGVPRVGIGIGINSGRAIVGNLGCSKFMNYTAIGDTINTAQRLETNAKIGEVWLSESIVLSVGNKIGVQPTKIERNVKLKGKKNPITAYVYLPPV